jgi:hypothetical protein
MGLDDATTTSLKRNDHNHDPAQKMVLALKSLTKQIPKSHPSPSTVHPSRYVRVSWAFNSGWLAILPALASHSIQSPGFRSESTPSKTASVTGQP